jgi:hypothetical protein
MVSARITGMSHSARLNNNCFIKQLKCFRFRYLYFYFMVVVFLCVCGGGCRGA